MQYRRLGRSGLAISEIGLGSWLTYGEAIDRRVSRECIASALDCGINFFDTADSYGKGEAERTLGEALEGVRRDAIVVGTKCFAPLSDNVNDRGLSRKHIVESVERSLRHLKLDYIDLMQCHRFDPETPLEETIRAMDDLIRQGKVLYWGVSRWSGTQTTESVGLAGTWRASAPVSNQHPYNILNLSIEAEVMPACAKAGVGVLAYSPLAQGVLTGKYTENETPAGSRAGHEPLRKGMWDYSPANIRKARQLSAVAAELGLSVAQMALAWCLRRPEVSGVIMGATSPKQITENVRASGVTLSREALEKIERVIKADQ